MTYTSTKLSLFLPSLRGGGAEWVMLQLAHGFLRRGHSVDLVVAEIDGPLFSQVSAGVNIVDLGASRVLYSLPKLVRYLKETQPAALLSTMDHANLVALWARRLAKRRTPVVIRVASTLSQATQGATGIKSKVIPSLVKRFYPWADCIIAVSHGVAEDLSSLVSTLKDQIQVIANPVDLEMIRDSAKLSCSHAWLQTAQTPVVIAVGRLTKAKDFPTLIKAFVKVHAQRDARLIILGEGEERAQLEELIVNLGLKDVIELMGFVENPYPYMEQASVFVLSSQWEGFPNVLVEALACGTPAVATDCPSGPREILQDGRYGTLVPVGDEGALTKAILDTLDHPLDPTFLQQRVEAYSVDRVVDQYLAVLLGKTQDT